MKICMAVSSFPANELVEALGRARVKNVLISYAYMKRYPPPGARVFADQLRAAGVRHVFLDSGAFTAHTQGKQLAVQDYERYITAIAPDEYASLDVIGDPRATTVNYDRMIADGFAPMPVVTRGTGSDLIRQVAERSPRLAIGGLVGRGADHRQAVDTFLRRVFAVTKSDVQVHGFGVGSATMLAAYPFATTDTSNAIINTGNRTIQTVEGLATRGLQGRQLRSQPHLVGLGRSERDARVERLVGNFRAYVLLEKRVTRLWTARGVTWDEEAA